MASISFEQLQREIDEAERYLRNQVTQRSSGHVTGMKQGENESSNGENMKIVRN
jgi:hypothetical protein